MLFNRGTEIAQPKISLQEVNNQYHAVNRVLKRYAAFVATQMLRTFAATAARFTPPNMGKANIQQKYYYRPIQQLAKLAKGEYPPYHATKADYAALRQGYKFRVLNTKVGHKRNEVHAYTIGINEAKRLSRIQNRGLARYTWGEAVLNNTLKNKKDFSEIKVETNLPPIFHRLAKKSPNITKYHFGEAKAEWKTGKDAYFHIQVINRLAQSERYCKIAIERGTIEVNRWANKFFNSVKDKLEVDVKKMIEDTHIIKKGT